MHVLTHAGTRFGEVLRLEVVENIDDVRNRRHIYKGHNYTGHNFTSGGR